MKLALFAFAFCLSIYNVGRAGTALITACVDKLFSVLRGR